MRAKCRGPLALVLVASLATACGDELEPEILCGEGTVEENGACIPTLACGAGTRLDAESGACLPDGDVCSPGTVEENGACIPSLACGAGTRLDAESGACLPDGDVCSPGTVLMDDRCEPVDDALEPDAVEADEPNDGGMAGVAGVIELPDVGADAFIAYGCIEPRDLDGDGSPDFDLDDWQVSVDGPTVIELETWSAGGLKPGFVAIGRDEALMNDGWFREGLDTTGGHSRWQFFLPTAGDYDLGVSDARTILANLPAGGPEACYYAGLRRLPLPEAVAVPSPVDVFPLESGVRFYSIEVAAGEVSEVFGETPRLNTSLGLTLLVDGEYDVSVVEEGGPVQLVIDESIAGDAVVAVDASIDFGYAPVEARVMERRSAVEGAR